MKLHDVVKQAHFANFYKSNNLNTIEEKIDYLTKAMKIRATRTSGKETPREELDGLEELAIFGFWRASW